MKLVCVEGQNSKNFIGISCKTKQDFEDLEVLRKVVTRTEFKPFIKSFNKSITESFLFNDMFIPATFIQELSNKALPALTQKVVIENTDLLFNKDLNREVFEDWIQSLPLPEHYDVYNEKYSFQYESVYRALLFKTAKIEVSTGGGKTMVTYLYARYLVDNVLNQEKYKGRNKILIIVPRTGLCKNTAKEIREEYDYLNDNPLFIDTIYSGSIRELNPHIIIGNWQSVKEYEPEWFNQFSAIIVDELHTAKVYSIKTEIFDKCKTVEFVFGMTGTLPEPNTLDYLQLVSMFGPTVLVKQTKELTDDGVIAPVKIQQIKINYEEDQLFSENLLESGIKGSEKYRIEKKYFQNNRYRNNILIDMINSMDMNQVILVESVEYVNLIADLIKERLPNKWVGIIHGKIHDTKREPIKQYMRDNPHHCVLVATYETMSTGENIKTVGAMHFPDGGRSKIRMKQSVGRGVRLHPLKEYLTVFDYQDEMNKCSFKNHARERNKLYKAEGHKFFEPIIYNI